MSQYKSAVSAALSKFRVKAFTEKTWPLLRGVVAVVANTHRGTTVDLYADAPGAYGLDSLPEWQAIRSASTEDYLAELPRVVSTAGVSIWSEPSFDEFPSKIIVGTAGRKGNATRDGSMQFLEPRAATELFLSDYQRGAIVSTGYNGNISTGMVLSSSYDDMRFPNASHGNGRRWSFLRIMSNSNSRMTGGRNGGRPVFAKTLDQLQALCLPGKTVVASYQTLDSGALARTEPEPYFMDKRLPNVTVPVYHQGSGVTSGNGAYVGMIFDSSHDVPPLYLYVHNPSDDLPAVSRVAVDRMLDRVTEYSWQQLGGHTQGIKPATGWEEIALMWPISPEFNTLYDTGSGPSALSPVHALPQLSSECGVETHVMMGEEETFSGYQFVTEDGVNVKVVVAGPCDHYMSIPLEWMNAWANRRHKEKRLTDKSLASIKEVAEREVGATIACVSYDKTVMLEKNLVEATQLHNDYADAKEKACKDNDFMEQRFNEHFTFGTLQTKLNGSLSTREFYAIREVGDYTQFVPRDLEVEAGQIHITLADGKVSSVALTGSTAGVYSSPDGDVAGALVAGYAITGGTKEQLLSWLGMTSDNLYDAEQASGPATKRAYASASNVSGRGEGFSFESHLTSFGGFPDYKRIVSIDPDVARHLAMTSKGAVLIGKSCVDLYHQSRSTV